MLAVVICTILLMLCPARSFGQQTFENFEANLQRSSSFLMESTGLLS